MSIHWRDHKILSERGKFLIAKLWLDGREKIEQLSWQELVLGLVILSSWVEPLEIQWPYRPCCVEFRFPVKIDFSTQISKVGYWAISRDPFIWKHFSNAYELPFEGLNKFEHCFQVLKFEESIQFRAFLSGKISFEHYQYDWNHFCGTEKAWVNTINFLVEILLFIFYYDINVAIKIIFWSSISVWMSAISPFIFIFIVFMNCFETLRNIIFAGNALLWRLISF